MVGNAHPTRIILCNVGVFSPRPRRHEPEKLNFRDPVSGETRTTTLEDSMRQGIETGKDMVQAAYAYYSDEIDRKTCVATIDGKNLETGLNDITKADIQFARTL